MMNLSILAHYLIWAFLFGESVLAVALFLSGIGWGVRGRLLIREAMDSGRRTLNQLRLALKKGTAKAARQAKKAIRADLSRKTDAMSLISRHLVTRELGQDEMEALIGLHIGNLERGVVHLCGLVARTAPLLGLAGTLVGVQMALSAFARNSTEPQLVLEGFATAIGTTLVGILVALFCLATSRLFWQPLIRKTMHDFMDTALELKAAVWEVDKMIITEKTLIKKQRQRDREARLEAMMNASSHRRTAAPGTDNCRGSDDARAKDRQAGLQRTARPE